MSPTSYQTAPPRMFMITNAVSAVKRLVSPHVVSQFLLRLATSP